MRWCFTHCHSLPCIPHSHCHVYLTLTAMCTSLSLPCIPHSQQHESQLTFANLSPILSLSSLPTVLSTVILPVHPPTCPQTCPLGDIRDLPILLSSRSPVLFSHLSTLSPVFLFICPPSPVVPLTCRPPQLSSRSPVLPLIFPPSVFALLPGVNN